MYEGECAYITEQVFMHVISEYTFFYALFECFFSSGLIWLSLISHFSKAETIISGYQGY